MVLPAAQRSSAAMQDSTACPAAGLSTWRAVQIRNRDRTTEKPFEDLEIVAFVRPRLTTPAACLSASHTPLRRACSQCQQPCCCWPSVHGFCSACSTAALTYVLCRRLLCSSQVRRLTVLLLLLLACIFASLLLKHTSACSAVHATDAELSSHAHSSPGCRL